MGVRFWVGFFWVCGLFAAGNPCATCHSKETEAYQQTGMARSFYPPSPQNQLEGSYFHRASDTWYAMLRRDGKYFQQQYQVTPDGQRINESEIQVDYILGSGNHSRSFLHRTPANTLVQLPLAWYAEKGGTWAMSPGYDSPDHQGFQRSVTNDCMFCHNAYPSIPGQRTSPRDPPIFTSIPAGIDCARCHGEGSRHIELAGGGKSGEQVRTAIVNPARLNADRQFEVCLQCHLETTSSALPASIVRYERGPFSYRPGEPLEDFILHFDHAPGRGFDDKFEITGSAYRLRKSRCFLESKGRLTCLTCHNPHSTQPVSTDVCSRCHSTLKTTHTNAKACFGCHMPKRRTEDVIHAVMTDHYIRRTPLTGDPLADIPERVKTYTGPVVPYYPNHLRDEDGLYLAIAQVAQSSNLQAGLLQFTEALRKYRPANPEYQLQLGDAWRNAGNYEKAIAAYRNALRTNAGSAPAHERLGSALAAAKQYPTAEAELRQAFTLSPAAGTLVQLALVQAQAGNPREAVATLQRAITLNPELPEAYNTAGALQLELGDIAPAEMNLRSAIKLQPNYAAAHNNLGNLLAENSRFDDARYHFEQALALQPYYVGARYNYALALARVSRYNEAEAQLKLLLSTPLRADAQKLLEQLLRK